MPDPAPPPASSPLDAGRDPTGLPTPLPPWSGRLVVGYDGTPASARALRWAAAEAARLGARLEVVSASGAGPHPRRLPRGIPGRGTSASGREDAPDVEDLAARGAQLAGSAIGALGGDPTEVIASPRPGSPGEVLVQASDGARLIVIGAQHRGSLTTAALGSTSQSVLTQARCPVVVVPRGPTRPAGAPLPIVVGLDGSAGSLAALELGAQLARAHTAPLHLVVCAQKEGSVGPDLLNRYAGWARTALPDQVVSGDVLDRDPVAALRQAGRRSELLVVGARGLGGFPALVQGSVSTALAQRAPCPLVVVPVAAPHPRPV